MRYIFLIVVFLGLALPASAARLQNEGFESGDASLWLCDGEGWRISSYSKDSYRGIYGAVNDVWTNGVSEYRVVHQEMDVKPGKVYRASVWVRAVCVEGSESFLEIQFMDRSGTILKQLQSSRVKRDQEYTQIVIDRITVPEHTDRVSIRGVVHLVTQPVKDTDYHVFDDFDFRQVTGPEALPAK